MTHATALDPVGEFRFDELDPAEAPSFESFWAGMFLGLAIVGLAT